MSDPVLVALITGGMSLLGVILSNMATSHRTEAKIQVNQAVTETKIDELTREVRKHNHFAERMPALEVRLDDLVQRVGHLEDENARYHRKEV